MSPDLAETSLCIFTPSFLRKREEEEHTKLGRFSEFNILSYVGKLSFLVTCTLVIGGGLEFGLGTHDIVGLLC